VPDLKNYSIEQMLHTLKTNGYIHISIHAQEYLQSFYEKLGFLREDDIFDEAGIPHIKMFLA
jgi:predicted GNAT family N-acyltransferase